MNRADLKTLKDNTFVSGNSSTRAVTVRSYEDDLIDSTLNLTDDVNANGGYLGVDGSGRVDVSKINSATPAGLFMKDDGTWAPVGLRIVSVATSTTPTPNITITDQYNVLALASAAAFGAPIGVAADGQLLILRIKDNGTARALSFDAIYRFNLGVSAPTTTVINKTLLIFLKWNQNTGEWQCYYTTQSSGSAAPSLTSTYVGYGDGSNLLTGTSNFTFDTAGLMIANGSSIVRIRELVGGSPNAAIYFNQGSPSSSNYAFTGSSTSSQVNATTSVLLNINDGAKLVVTAGNTAISNDLIYKNQYSNTATPAIAAGAGAGGSPTIAIAGTNKVFTITLTTGTLPTTGGIICTVTFAGGFAFPNGSVGAVTNGDDATAIASIASIVYAVGTTTTIQIKTVSAGALPAATSFVLNCIIEGY